MAREVAKKTEASKATATALGSRTIPAMASAVTSEHPEVPVTAAASGRQATASGNVATASSLSSPCTPMITSVLIKPKEEEDDEVLAKLKSKLMKAKKEKNEEKDEQKAQKSQRKLKKIQKKIEQAKKRKQKRKLL